MSLKKYLLALSAIACIALSSLFFQACGDDDGDGDSAPAMFAFKDNLAVAYDSEVTVSIEVYQQDIESIEVLINDSVVKSWKSPNKKFDFKLNTAVLGIGAKNFDLKSTYGGGKSYTDQRLIRVVSNVVPEDWTLSILSSTTHNTDNFTQGLEFNQGELFESTGQQGQSKIAKIDLTTGKDILQIGLDATHFGEGITILGDTIFQLTWTSGRCFLYDKNTLKMLSKEFSYNGEGWGLCNDGKSLIMSDGTERITFRNPKTFGIERTIEVYTNNDAVINLNELEYVDGFIYANIWMTNKIVVIEPETGRVIAAIDGSELVRMGRGAVGDSFNGIAFNQKTNKLYLTGKKWEKLFEVKVNKPNA